MNAKIPISDPSADSTATKARGQQDGYCQLCDTKQVRFTSYAQKPTTMISADCCRANPRPSNRSLR
jgi:hypothetical protein